MRVFGACIIRPAYRSGCMPAISELTKTFTGPMLANCIGDRWFPLCSCIGKENGKLSRIYNDLPR
jgi:hypothetical protein